MNDDSGDVRKSVGIDKEGGLVFALDTMQVINPGSYIQKAEKLAGTIWQPRKIGGKRA